MTSEEWLQIESDTNLYKRYSLGWPLQRWQAYKAYADLWAAEHPWYRLREVPAPMERCE